MRKRFLIMVALFGLALSSAAVGSIATFTSQQSAGQAITVGSMAVVLDGGNGSQNPDGSFTCPDFHALTASGSSDQCRFNVSIVGSVVPTSVSIDPSLIGASEPGKWMIVNDLTDSGMLPLVGRQAAKPFALSGADLPQMQRFHVVWADLDTKSMNDKVKVRFTVTAVQS